MGYTHYFQVKKEKLKETQELARELSKQDKYQGIVEERLPNTYNGIGDLQHEDLWLVKADNEFTKTARKPYDDFVQEVLYIANEKGYLDSWDNDDGYTSSTKNPDVG